MHSLNKIHLEVVYKILIYLKGSLRKWLFFKKGEGREIGVFTDVDWAGSTEDRRSITRYYTFV